MPENGENEALKFAMKLIGIRRRSVFEIKQRLTEKGFNEEVIEKTMAELSRFKYLDDELFAESYINDRLNFRPAGKFVIAHELAQKGIDKKIIDNKLNEALDDNKQIELAQKLLQKKIRTMPQRDLKENKNRLKLINYLKSRGFSGMIISQAIKNEIEFNQEESLEN